MKMMVSILTTGLVLAVAGTAAAQKNKTPTCGSDVYLNVQVVGTPNSPNGNGLISDGNEFYNHGSSRGLVARFQVENCTQDFTMGTGNNRKMIARLSSGDVDSTFFNADRVHSVPVTPSALFTEEARAAWLASPFCANGVQRNPDGTIVKNADGSYQDNYAGCGIDEQGNGYVVRVMSASLQPDAHLVFNVSPIDRPAVCVEGNTAPNCGASRVRVYHPFETRWIVRADATAMASYTVWSKGAYVFQGYENVPLEIIADRK